MSAIRVLLGGGKTFIGTLASHAEHAADGGPAFAGCARFFDRGIELAVRGVELDIREQDTRECLAERRANRIRASPTVGFFVKIRGGKSFFACILDHIGNCSYRAGGGSMVSEWLVNGAAVECAQTESLDARLIVRLIVSQS